MKTILISLLLLTTAGITGCRQESAPAPTGPISLTKEEAEAIAQQDSTVQQAEGGAFLANQAKAKARKK